MNLVFKLSLFCLCSLILLQIWVSHTMVEQGANLQKIKDLQSALIQENLMLENTIATASSYLNIATRSAEFGFSTPKALQYIR